ncbi:MAG: alkaline phosphatase family protein [Peptococcaceae bacterium]|nr:alkaline phosphatase family protein [Peptococcaceae bacterium]
MGSSKGKVLVLGLDGMEPYTTKRMVEAGKMPNVKKLLEVGAAREDLELLGAMPTITPAQWTTLACGCYPNLHGVTDFWNQDPEELDGIIYGLDSRLCQAEQMWNVTAEAGKKTLVWQWPGSSWPPTSNSENLFVVDGTQPASVNYSIANIDIEKYVVASSEFTENKFIDHICSYRKCCSRRCTVCHNKYVIACVKRSIDENRPAARTGTEHTGRSLMRA